MKNFILSSIVVGGMMLLSNKLQAAPVLSVPLNESDGVEIGSFSFQSNAGAAGVFFDYDVTDTPLTVLMLKMVLTNNNVSWPNTGGLGAVQLFNGSTQVLAPYAAASKIPWFGDQSANTWYDADSVPGAYHIQQAIYLGNNGSAGDGGYSNYTFATGGVGDVTYYYIGFESPVYITDIRLGDGAQSFQTYDVTAIAFSAPGTVPEPASMMLLALGVVGLIKKVRK